MAAKYASLALLLSIFLTSCKTTDMVSHEVVPTPVEVPAASEDQNGAIPLDAAVRHGQLDNGIAYYIRHNEEPANRAELRLVINAGSMQEDDDQLGMAHFLEHMLFNGTERFQEQELIDFLESTGMRFGPDVNAYTSFDETVYMLTIPTDSSAIIEKAFDVLEDWAASATIDPEEVDKERGVVVEEWRRRTQGANGRIQDQTFPVLLKDSRYRSRLPIGDTTIILNGPQEALMRFYKDWYRPDLMAVVAVGDMDVDQTEALIRTHFEHFEPHPDPRERVSHSVPGHEETLFAIITDPEFPATIVEVYYKRDADQILTPEAYRASIVSGFFTSMLNSRFSEITQRPHPPFVGAGVSRGNIVRTGGYYSIGARVQDDSTLTGLRAVLIEAKRVREHGFTETELDRQKHNTLRRYLRAYNERNNRPSAGFAREYVSHYLEDEPSPGIEYEYQLIQEILPTITTEEVNALADDLLAEENRVIMASMPEREGLIPPSEIELESIFARVNAMAVEPWVDEVSDAPLFTAIPTPSPIAKEGRIDSLDIAHFTLENGIRVFMKTTDFREDEIRFMASSPGGTSLVSDEDYFTASNASMLVRQSGVGTFDRNALQKKLAGKVVSVVPFVGTLSEGLRGSASPDDLETLFQLIYLYVHEPRADSSALTTFQNQMRAYLPNRLATPAGVFQDSLMNAIYGKHPRTQVPTLEMVDALDLYRAKALYEDRFADMGDFSFVFAGNFDPVELKELAQTYLGSLPTGERKEAWEDVMPKMPEGLVNVEVRKGIADQSQVLLLFHGPFDYNRVDRHRFRSMVEVLSTNLREELRENLGGVYSVAAQPRIESKPTPSYQVTVNFTCDPDRVDELIDAVFAQIERLKAGDTSADDLQKVQEQQRRTRETQRETNAFWIGIMEFYLEHTDEEILDVLRYEELIDSITPADIQAAAQRYFGSEQYVRAVLYPESQP